MSDPRHAAIDLEAITYLIHESHFLVDTGRSEELADVIFAEEVDGAVPEADFGFITWRGSDAIRAGYPDSMQRFEAALHVVSNLRVDVDGPRAVAQYYLQGWHWLAERREKQNRNADFLVLGIMTDQLIMQAGHWRILSRRLERVGPGVAFGQVPEWLNQLGSKPD